MCVRYSSTEGVRVQGEDRSYIHTHSDSAIAQFKSGTSWDQQGVENGFQIPWHPLKTISQQRGVAFVAWSVRGQKLAGVIAVHVVA